MHVSTCNVEALTLSRFVCLMAAVTLVSYHLDRVLIAAVMKYPQLQDAGDKPNGSPALSRQAEAASASSQTQTPDAKQSTSESPGWLTRLAKASKNFLSLD